MIELTNKCAICDDYLRDNAIRLGKRDGDYYQWWHTKCLDESFVEEQERIPGVNCPKGGTILAALEWEKKKQMETELSLLVIDMGESCVVKAEQGHLDETPLSKMVGTYLKENLYWVSSSFAELRAAIDGEKPVPRIERELLAFAHKRYYVYFHNTRYPISLNAYAALSKLAGKPLPIWEGGKWERLIHAGQPPFGPQTGTVPVSIWRYTR